MVIHLRRTLLLPMDDLLAVTRQFIRPMSRVRASTGVCAVMGLATLNALKPQEPVLVHKAFKSYEPGYLHMDV